jgi:hypothetical protein
MARRKSDDKNVPYYRTLRQAEKSMIEYAVQCAGSLRKAAPLLGISESFLITRAKKLGVVSPNQDQSKKPKKPRTPPATPPTTDEQPNNVVQLPSRAVASGDSEEDAHDPGNA